MFFDLYNQSIKVFLSDSTADVDNARINLANVLLKAGMEIVNATGLDENSMAMLMQQSDCSVHVLGNVDIYNTKGAGYDSACGKEYRIAKRLCSNSFKMFVWNPSGVINENNAYINNIRRDIVENTIYIDKISPIVFVEELRNIMNVKPSVVENVSNSEIFFIYNELDSNTAKDVYNMLKDFQSVVKLGVSMADNVDYGDYITQQLSNCKIGVVYYNFAHDWAVSFARQLWKDTGGNSSQTPIFVVGNSEHATNKELEIFKGILECSIDEQSRIPLDITMFLDKVKQK